MTHPTLSYANLRFAGDDAVHMPATPIATMTTACLASGPGEEPLPHDVDAQVTCPNCLHALESDWWMALLENERRTGEVSSLSGTLDDVRDAMGRLLSQIDAVTEETLLDGCVYDGPDEVEFTHGGEVVDRSEYDYPDRNWCHVHNREAQAGREECSECDGEQGEDRKAGES